MRLNKIIPLFLLLVISSACFAEQIHEEESHISVTRPSPAEMKDKLLAFEIEGQYGVFIFSSDGMAGNISYMDSNLEVQNSSDSFTYDGEVFSLIFSNQIIDLSLFHIASDKYFLVFPPEYLGFKIEKNDGIKKLCGTYNMIYNNETMELDLLEDGNINAIYQGHTIPLGFWTLKEKNIIDMQLDGKSFMEETGDMFGFLFDGEKSLFAGCLVLDLTQ